VVGGPNNRRYGSDRQPEGHWTKVIAIGTVILVILAILTYVGYHFSHSGNTTTTTISDGSTTTTPTPTSQASAFPVYLDSLSPTGGDPPETGLCTIESVQYSHGLRFQLTSTVETQSVDYKIPVGAKSFTAVIGNDDHQDNIDGVYEMLNYELIANSSQLLQDWQVMGTNHPMGPQVVALPATATELTLKITVSAGTQEGATTADWAGAAFN